MKTLQERAKKILQTENASPHGTLLELSNLYSSEIGQLISPYATAAVPALIVSFEGYAKALREKHPLQGLLADLLSRTVDVETTRKEADTHANSSP